MTDAEFSELVADGIAALGEGIRERMKNVAIVIADTPNQEQQIATKTGPDDILFGLYEGVPQTERGVMEEVVLPDKITIFKQPILAVYDDPADIAACVANTVWHEVAHHFGMTEDEVAQEELRRGKEK